jgi:lysophospholipase L1-like esterase
MKRVALIGDSIRQGYQETVHRELRGVADVWGPEENGGDSVNVLLHLQKWLQDGRPDVIHLNCGLHDIKKERGAITQQTPINQYECNLRTILRRLRRESQAVVLWATTTPVNPIWHNARKEFDRLEADVLAYNGVAVRVAEEFRVPVNDLHRVVTEHGRDRLLQPDGVHFNEEGCRVLGKAVAGFVRPYLAA